MEDALQVLMSALSYFSVSRPALRVFLWENVASLMSPELEVFSERFFHALLRLSHHFSCVCCALPSSGQLRFASALMCFSSSRKVTTRRDRMSSLMMLACYCATVVAGRRVGAAAYHMDLPLGRVQFRCFVVSHVCCVPDTALLPFD
eukprot:4273320-Prymnesium_polylepis.1